MKQIDMDEIYKNVPLKNIPWNIETPPDILVHLIDSGQVKPCKALDLGCGIGNYAIYLALKGFNVTGIDISSVAIRLARENAKKKMVGCNFIVADVLTDLVKVVKNTFDFAYDWELLHHIFPQKRQKYIENVYNVLNPGGKYLSVCFNDKDYQFGGSGKYRKTQLGTVLYFSSERELKNLFSSYFSITDLKILEIKGKTISHIVNYAFMEKK